MIGTRARIVVLAGILGAAVALGAGAPAATAQTLPLSYDLGVVLPGESRSMERPIEVPRTVTVVSADFGSTSDEGLWHARLCDVSETCTRVSDLDDRVLTAGDYRLVVTLTMPTDLDLPLSASAEGTMTLLDAGVEATDILPATGGSSALTTAVLGGALAAGGALLVIAAGRRRREAEETL